jgi:hypothetical protein
MTHPEGRGGEVNAEPTGASEETAASATDASVERRLAALTDAIRARDWRAPRDSAGPPTATPQVVATEALVTADLAPDGGPEAGPKEADAQSDAPIAPESSPTAPPTPQTPPTGGRSTGRRRHAAPKARRGRFWSVALLLVLAMAST